MMRLHIFAFALVFVNLALAAPGGIPQPKWFSLEWSKGTESITINGGSSIDISSFLNANDVSKKIVKTSKKYNIDINCNHIGQNPFVMRIEWNGGASKFDQKVGSFKQHVPAKKAKITVKAGTGTSFIFLYCTITAVPASVTTTAPATTTKAPATTTKAPATTTKAPASTTKAPATTTKAPGGSCNVPTKSTCKCGKQSLASRIVGGVNAKLGEAPWQVGLMFNSADGQRYQPVFCGGTIVSPYHVITAAHCTTADEKEKGKYAVVYGTLKYTTSPQIEVEKVYDHPDYNTKTAQNDITVLKLAKPLPFSATVAPACLPDASLDYAGKAALVSGWGDTAFEFGQAPEILQKLSVSSIATKEACNAAWGYRLNVDTQVCLITEANKGVFSGDSGGPMVALNKGSYDLVGAASFVNGANPGGHAAVYTRVSGFLPWINKIICETSTDYYCSK